MPTRKELRDLKRNLRAAEISERPEGRSRAERRRENRDEKIPEPRICPECKEPKPRSRQWTIYGPLAVCLSCWRKMT